MALVTSDIRKSRSTQLPLSRDLGTARLHHFFETSAGRFPDAVAVEDSGVRLSYAELDRRANQLAHHLRSAGLRSGGRAGVLLHRSLSTYAAILAVLKAGGAFVPIDPASPADRVGFIADDAGIDVLITATDLVDSAGGVAAPLVVLDHIEDALRSEPDTRPDVSEEGDPAAYVIYTSGSTGRPKGVEVAQSSICNFITVVPGVYDVRPSDRVYQGMTISFDFSIEEIWPTFAVGAALVVGPNDSRRLGAELADFLDDTAVTLLYCVPTLLATIPRDLPTVRGLMVGGEACPAGLVERWARPGRRMLNTYGPTEATVTATWGELLPGRPVTIGRPMPTYSVVILDEDLRPVADGVAGEIGLGGPGVAVGYVGLPEKTAERFVRIDGRRIYRTGDLGRVDGNGEIVYLGRADDEVKIRGHRVDLGEIDSVLLEDPEIESAVAAMMAVGGTQELVAYVVCHTSDSGVDHTALIERLHARLSARVPDYMVPGYLEVLPELPTMPSSKVDRKRLPRPAGRRLLLARGTVVAPRGALETAVRDAWAAAFGLTPEDVSVTADFFADLGGHSLLAASAVSLMRERGVGTSPAVRDLYANPTVRAMAARLQDRAQATPTGADPRSRPERIRSSSGRYSWAGVVQAAFLYALMLLLTMPVVAIYVGTHGQVSLLVLVGIALAATGVYWGLRWLLTPALVHALGAGISPGRYRLWSATYLQLWAMDVMLSLAPLPVLSGSPLINSYLRLLGATIGRDVHIGTSMVGLPALLHIGDGATLGYGVALRPWVVEDGWVVVAPITVGARAFVGAGAVLEPGATVGDGAVLAEQSAAVRHQVIPGGEHWVGSPSAKTDRSDTTLAALATAGRAPDWTRWQLASVVGGLSLLELLPLLTLVPTVLLVWGALLAFGELVGLLAALLVGPVFVATVCVVILVVHRLVLPSTPVGLVAARSGLGVRKWMADKLLEMSLEVTNSLYATLYTAPWLRALGASIGKGSEISTVAHVDPDLLTLGEGSFVADMASLGGATFRDGWVSFRRTEVGSRAFVGNAAMVPPGSRLGDGSLVGVQTVPPPDGVPAGSSWLGSPAMHLPVRQSSGEFAETSTFTPPRRRVVERLAIEFVRVTLPSSLIAAVVYLYLLSLASLAAAGTDLATIALIAPMLAVLFGLSVSGMVAMVKWTVVGTYRARVEPLWSRFVRRAEFVTGLYEAAAVPAMLFLLVGTPFLPPMMRLFGADIGKRTFLATTYLTEFDLVEIDDDATVGRDVSLQTHLFEDRVMKMSTVHIGAGATVGDRAIVLYDSAVGADTALEPLSLVMKGEHLPAGTRWRGIPAEGVA